MGSFRRAPLRPAAGTQSPLVRTMLKHMRERRSVRNVVSPIELPPRFLPDVREVAKTAVFVLLGFGWYSALPGNLLLEI